MNIDTRVGQLGNHGPGGIHLGFEGLGGRCGGSVEEA